MVLLLELPVPPPQSAYYGMTSTVASGGQSRPIVYISAVGRTYRKRVANVLKYMKYDRTPMLGRIKVQVIFHFETKRACDLDNRLKCLFDTLTNCVVWGDDDQVDEIHVTRGEKRPGGVCFVQIEEMET